MATVKEQLEEAQRQLASKDSELARLRGQQDQRGRQSGGADLDNFKAEVVDRVMQIDCGCTSPESILSDLGLEAPTRKISFSCTGNLEAEYELNTRFLDAANHPADWEQWLDEHLHLENSDLYSHLDGEGAWDSDIEETDTYVNDWHLSDIEFIETGGVPYLRFTIVADMRGTATISEDTTRPAGDLVRWLDRCWDNTEPEDVDLVADDADVEGWEWQSCCWSINSAEWAD